MGVQPQGGLAGSRSPSWQASRLVGKHLAADSRSGRVGIRLPGGLITEASTHARTCGFRGRAPAPGIMGEVGGAKEGSGRVGGGSNMRRQKGFSCW